MGCYPLRAALFERRPECNFVASHPFSEAIGHPQNCAGTELPAPQIVPTFLNPDYPAFQAFQSVCIAFAIASDALCSQPLLRFLRSAFTRAIADLLPK